MSLVSLCVNLCSLLVSQAIDLDPFEEWFAAYALIFIYRYLSLLNNIYNRFKSLIHIDELNVFSAAYALIYSPLLIIGQ